MDAGLTEAEGVPDSDAEARELGVAVPLPLGTWLELGVWLDEGDGELLRLPDCDGDPLREGVADPLAVAVTLAELLLDRVPEPLELADGVPEALALADSVPDDDALGDGEHATFTPRRRTPPNTDVGTHPVPDWNESAESATPVMPVGAVLPPAAGSFHVAERLDEKVMRKALAQGRRGGGGERRWEDAIVARRAPSGHPPCSPLTSTPPCRTQKHPYQEKSLP